MIPLFRAAVDADAISRTVETLIGGYIGQGPQVESFEQVFKQMVDAPYPPLAVNSCTSAITLALQLIGVGPGDEVISTPMTCAATNAPIVLSGARIVWADIDPLTGLINPQDVAQKVTSKTKAIVAVDWGGRPCDYETLKRFDVPVIEDAAHAFLALCNGQSIARTGGDYVCWSFQAIKHLTTGDGGALLAPEDQMERGRLLRWYGLDRRSGVSFRASQDIAEVGGKYHMNDIAATIGLGNLPGAAVRVEACRDNAQYYHDAFKGVDGITRPPANPYASWWLYTLLADDRDRFVREMADNGVETGAVHARNDHHSGFGTGSRSALPGVDHFSAHEVAIPVGWWLTPKERSDVRAAVWQACQVGRPLVVPT